MCGIVGYTGREAAAPIVLNGLSKLEYRGYDSAGVAVFNEAENDIDIVKTKGRLKNLLEKTDSGKAMPGGCGIGHTRWATHGAPSEKNAHPHCSDDKMVVMVHNGIIENYQELKDHLTQKGYTFYSETDTEVAVKLIAYYYEKTDHNPLESMSRALLRVRGSFALGIMFKDRPGVVYAARKDSPLIVGQNEGGAFIASDLTAFIKYSKRYFIVPEYAIMTMTADGITIEDFDGKTVEPEYLEVNWDVTAAQKDGYPHFMIKEIHEQPAAITKTITPRIKDSLPCFEDDNIPDSFFEDISDITVVACGTAMYAGMVGKALLKNKFGIPVTVAIASEFRYEQPVLTDRSMVIFVSQSGETIDTLEALRLANKYTKKTLSIVNVKGSSIARESNYVLYTHAGPEIAVASTKAYTVQAASFYLLGCKLGLVSGKMTEADAKEFIENLQEVPNLIESVITQAPEIEQHTKRMTNATNAFNIGRGLDYAKRMKGALKL